jgi:hypothetical protein
MSHNKVTFGLEKVHIAFVDEAATSQPAWETPIPFRGLFVSLQNHGVRKLHSMQITDHIGLIRATTATILNLNLRTFRMKCWPKCLDGKLMQMECARPST